MFIRSTGMICCSIFHAISYVTLVLITTSVAFSWDFDVDRIPNGEVFDCSTCHRSGSYQLNSFGSAYNNAGDTWTVALANADSDGDGYSNGTELLDPAGSWQTGQADPGNPSDVTNPADSSSHPSDPTPTPTPTGTAATPTQTASTPTQTPTPSQTPQECSSTGVTIIMPSVILRPGDTVFCDIDVCNQESDVLEGYPLIVILDVFGQYFFAPGFGSTLDFYSQSFAIGMTTVQVLPEFSWPEGAGTAAGIIWYAALTDPSITSLFGTMDSLTFGWTE